MKSKSTRELQAYLESEFNEDAKRPFAYRYFKQIFENKFKVESQAAGGDIYIDGELLIELKTSGRQLLEGFYQALHYRKKGLTFTAFGVMASQTLCLWRLDTLPEEAFGMANRSNPLQAPSSVGKENAKATSKELRAKILGKAVFKITPSDFGLFLPKIALHLAQFQKIITNLDTQRFQIDTLNFIEKIEQMERFFQTPLDAIHGFYDIIGGWDVTSKITQNDNGEVRLLGKNSLFFSEPLQVSDKLYKDFKKFVERHYVFTNEGSGLTEDYYFSRFDEVISRLDPEYAKQHGIFFTDENLSKFAHWFIKYYSRDNLANDYIIIDPAGGSGNLVTNSKGLLKHKIISELQIDLLKVIERRMKLDEDQIHEGFTIVPKVSDGVGLNFLDKSAQNYLDELTKAMQEQMKQLNKPLAFIVNPPYKNTDENKKVREGVDANYLIHDSIIELTGKDAGKERYLAFLGQMVNIAKLQVEQNPDFKPMIMVFTPTSWLIPRKTYIPFREEFDRYFKYINGFITNSKEFFKVGGKWPLAFTIWQYNYKENKNRNMVKVKDFTELKAKDLNNSVNWLMPDKEINKQLKKIYRRTKTINFSSKNTHIKGMMPLIERKGKFIPQPRYNAYRNKTKDENDVKIVSGFPLNDERHTKIKAPHGFVNGEYIGFMDDVTPVRLRIDTCNRMSNNPDRVWFRLDSDFKGINKVKLFNGPTDNRSYCAYDIESAKAAFTWFCIAKSSNGKYPMWANQFDLWMPEIKPNLKAKFYSLCFAFALAENRCVVTKFEADNPVKGAPEVFVDNPLCPTNQEAFWATTLLPYIQKHKIPIDLVDKITALYKTWNVKYCKGNVLRNIGLHDEPYFKYFDYADFLTPYSGLIQIKKYAQINGDGELLVHFEEITRLTSGVRNEIYRMLVEDFKYFE